MEGGDFGSLPFEKKLDRLAEVAVRVGLGLQAGQELLISAPTEALALVRCITEHAYRAGAKLVTTLLTDDAVTLCRYRFAADETFDAAPVWLHEGIYKASREEQRGWRSPARTPPCWPGRMRPRSRARASRPPVRASRPWT